jgi:hypothetical protein
MDSRGPNRLLKNSISGDLQAAEQQAAIDADYRTPWRDEYKIRQKALFFEIEAVISAWNLTKRDAIRRNIAILCSCKYMIISAFNVARAKVRQR